MSTRLSSGLTRRAAALFIATSCSACAIQDMKRDNLAAEGRIKDKTKELTQHQEQQAKLADAKAQLLNDLRTRDASVQELADQVDWIRRLNDASSVQNAGMIQAKQQAAHNLKDVAEQLRAIQQQRAGESSVATAKRIAAEKQKVRDRLELILAN